MPMPESQPIMVPQRRADARPRHTKPQPDPETESVPFPWSQGPRCHIPADPATPADGVVPSPWQELGCAPALFEAWLKGP